MRDPDAKRLGPLPNASGAITRLAYASAKRMGVGVELLSKKAVCLFTKSKTEACASKLEIKSPF